MANLANLMPLIEKWEGEYVYDPDDPGGPTYRGITLATWKKAGYDINQDGKINLDDLLLITHEEMMYNIVKPYYWDVWQADDITNQSLANLLVDWLWCSGPTTIRIVQKLLGVESDGMVGKHTLAALNSHPDPLLLHSRIKAARNYYLNKICAQRPTLAKFKRGWKKRVADFRYAPLLALIISMVLTNTGCRSPKTVTQTTVLESAQQATTRHQQSDSVASRIQTAHTSYREALHEQVVETLEIRWQFTDNPDSTTSDQATPRTGIAHYSLTKQTITGQETTGQEIQLALEQEEATQQTDSTRQHTLKKARDAITDTGQAVKPRHHPFVVTGILLSGILLLVYMLRR